MNHISFPALISTARLYRARMEEKMSKNREIIDSVEKLGAAIAELRKVQAEFATYSQEQVDKIFLAAATAANKQRIPLAKMAVQETGMGIVEDKA